MTASMRRTQPGPRQPGPRRGGFLSRWWPALLGLGVLLLGLGVFVVITAWRGEDGRAQVSAVSYSADLTPDGGGGSNGSVEVEVNAATDEVCYRVLAPTVSRPFVVALAAAADGGAEPVIELGRHISGSIGCVPAEPEETEGILASPEAHVVRLVEADGAVSSGPLVYDPQSGDGVAAPTPTDGGSEGDEGATVAAGERDPNKAGFILPDLTSSIRWEQFDRPLIQAACEDAGIECLIENAEGDSQAMSEIADRMIADGVSVLALVNLDSTSAAAIQERAAAAGVRNIDYDRLTLDGRADVYVSFDNVAVGRAQGEGLLQCLGDQADGARIIQLHGSPDDNNATLVRQGYQEVLEGSGVETVGEAPVPGWDNDEAGVIFRGLLNGDAGGSVDGVIVANDGMSQAAQAVLGENGITVPTTGQDASIEGLRSVLQGTQCMTVYKPVKVEADAVVKAAVALMRGVDPPANTTIDNGTAEIPFVQGQVTPIFADDVRIPVQDGFVGREEVCEGIEQLCQQAGIN